MSCPTCGFGQYDSNLIDLAPFQEARSAVYAHPRLNHPAILIGTNALLGGVKLANLLRKKHRCSHCGTKY